MRSAGLDAGVELKKDGKAKEENDALGEQRPRLIFSGGDVAVATHIFDAGVLEDLFQAKR